MELARVRVVVAAALVVLLAVLVLVLLGVLHAVPALVVAALAAGAAAGALALGRDPGRPDRADVTDDVTTRYGHDPTLLNTHIAQRGTSQQPRLRDRKGRV
jgi:hypothetical protein